MDLLIVTTCSISMALLGLLVLIRNPSQADNRRFAFIAFSLIAWSVANYLSDNAVADNLLYTRLTFLGGVTAVFAFVLFVSNFPNKATFGNKVIANLHTALTALMVPIIFSPEFIVSVSQEGGEHGTIHTSYLYPLFIIYILYSLLLLFFIGVKQRKGASDYAKRQQMSLVFGSITFYGILVTTSNVLLPLIKDDWSSSRFGPLFTLIFVALIAYAVATKRLFDVHFFAVRAAAYLSTLFLVSVFCVTPIVLLFGYFLDFNPSNFVLALVVATSVIASYLLEYLRRVFDKLTSRIFFRHYYNPQEVLSKISDLVVRVVDMKLLTKKTAAILKLALKSDYVEYALFKYGSQKSAAIAEELQAVSSSDIIVIDDLPYSSNLKHIDYLKSERVAIAIKLRTTHENLGFITLGHKQSGEIYNMQDKRMLSTVASEVAISLQNAIRFEEIQRFNETLQKKVDIATRRLSESNHKLKVLNETKDDFIGMASHQLRTPLTSVKGYLSLVIDGDAGKVNATQKKLLTQAFISSQRMVYLIADLLNVSRLRTGKFIVERAPTNIATTISDELEQLREMASSRGIDLTFDAPQDFPVLPLDETKTRQVIMNFMDNAIYYTPSGGHVRVELRDLPESVELRVIDDGIGVPKDEAHHMFTKFYRAKNAQRARPDGTGLGLFMAKKVIVAQGGAVIFNSKEGEGSTFGFTFPKDLPVDSEVVAATL